MSGDFLCECTSYSGWILIDLGYQDTLPLLCTFHLARGFREYMEGSFTVSSHIRVTVLKSGLATCLLVLHLSSKACPSHIDIWSSGSSLVLSGRH